jgi:Tfp pilus assembly protein PilO
MNESSKKNNNLEVVKKFLVKNFYLVVILLVVIILLLGFIFLLKPRYEKVIGNDSYSKEQLQKDEDASKEYLSQINTLLNMYNSISKDDISKINTILPNCGSNEDIIAQIDYLIKKNGLRLNSISISEKNESKKTGNAPKVAVKTDNSSSEVHTVVASINVSGADYKAFKNLLNIFETNSRLMDIKKIDFAPAKFSLNLEIEAYCL